MCVKVIASQRWDVFWDMVYNVPAQETAKHCAKFGWPPVSNVDAATKARCETRCNLLGCPTLRNRSQLLVDCGPKFAISRGHVEEILLFNYFFQLSIHALATKIQPNKVVRWCPDGKILAIFVSCIFCELRAAHFRLHSKFALRPHYVWKYTNLRRLRIGEEKKDRKN